MRFAHIADCHIGAGSNQALREITINNFCKAISECINKKVDFVLISGDLFDNPLPSIDVLKLVVKNLKALADNGIPVFAIPGSHDYSPTNKTMLSVLESAGLLVNVARVEHEALGEHGALTDNKIILKPFIDNNLCVVGVPGRFSGLEKDYFNNLVVDCYCGRKPDKKEETLCTKIFMFHTAITEFLQKNMVFESIPADALPKGFDYYAGGHLHIKSVKRIGDKLIAYPGPLACTSFDEFLSIKKNSFFIVSIDKTGYNAKHNVSDNGTNNTANNTANNATNNPTLYNTRIEEVVVSDYKTLVLDINADNKTGSQVTEEILNKIQGMDLNNTVLLLRVKGVLAKGRPSDIDFSIISSKATSLGCRALIRNTSKLSTKDFEESSIDAEITDVDALEREIIKQHIGQSKTWFSDREETLINELMNVLSLERSDEESKSGYHDRIISEAENTIKRVLGVKQNQNK